METAPRTRRRRPSWRTARAAPNGRVSARTASASRPRTAACAVARSPGVTLSVLRFMVEVPARCRRVWRGVTRRSTRVPDPVTAVTGPRLHARLLAVGRPARPQSSAQATRAAGPERHRATEINSLYLNIVRITSARRAAAALRRRKNQISSAAPATEASSPVQPGRWTTPPEQPAEEGAGKAVADGRQPAHRVRARAAPSAPARRRSGRSGPHTGRTARGPTPTIVPAAPASIALPLLLLCPPAGGRRAKV